MKKNIFLVISVICFFIFGIMGIKEYIKSIGFYKDLNEKIFKQVNESLLESKKQIEKNVTETNSLLNNISAELKKIELSATSIPAYFKTQIAKQKKLSGLGIAILKKDANNNLLFAGIQKNIGKTKEFIQITDADKNLPWLKTALKENITITEAYFDKSVKSYSFALISKLDGIKFGFERNTAVILFGIISTVDIKNIVEDLDFGSRGYAFMTNQNGNIILHPLEKNLFLNFKDIVKPKYTYENNAKLAKCFNEKVDTYIDEKDFSNSSNRKIIAISYSTELKSFIGAILNKAEIGFPFKELKSLRMRNTLYISFTILFLCFFIASFKTEAPSFMKRIKSISIVITIVFAFSIGFLWYLERFYGMENPGLIKGYISDKASLKKFLQNETALVNENKSSEKLYALTGILVQSIKIMGVNEAQVSGIIWQKISAEQKGKFKEGLTFPDAISVRSEEIYRTMDTEKNQLIGWAFTAILRQQFENKLFPFEKLDLKIHLAQKSLMEKVQLIPDFSSFDEYSTSSNSFLSKDITVSDWIVKQTYFTVNQKEYMTTFGYSKAELKNNSSDLLLNITLQRDFLSNFFSTFLPFFVLLLLAYVGLLFSSNDEAKSKIFSFKASNMQGIASGFLLFLVFSIVSIRKQAISSELLYIEYLYFFTFFVLLTLVLSVVHIYGSKNTALGYKDGFFVKQFYWPVILTSIFLITYYNFI